MTVKQLFSAFGLASSVVVGACARDASTSGTIELATVFDSTGDTVRATVRGVVSPDRIRHLVPELRMASERADSVIFGVLSEFAISADGRVMAFDPTASQLLLFAPDGTPSKVGRAGGGPGEYRELGGLTALGDSMFAAYDPTAARISFFRPDGSFATSWPTPPTTIFGQNMLATDTTGRIRLAQLILPATGAITDARMAMAAVVTGGAALADSVVAPTLGVKQPEYRTQSVSSGSRTSTMITGQLAPAEVTAWHPHGFYVLMEGGGYRLLFARRAQKPLVVSRNAPAIPVADDERAWHEERTLFVMRRTNPAWTWEGPPIPSVRAGAKSMFVARDGKVWVYVTLPSELIPEAERAQPREGTAPPARWRERGEYEVFAPDGRFLGRVALPPRTTLRTADGDRVWATQTGEDDVPALVRFRVTPGWQ